MATQSEARGPTFTPSQETRRTNRQPAERLQAGRMAAEFLSGSDPITRVTIGIIDQSEFVSTKIKHLDPGPAILIAAAGVELESNEPHSCRAKLPSVPAATAVPGGRRYQPTSRDKRSFRDHGIPLKIRDGCDTGVRTAGNIKTGDKGIRPDTEIRAPSIFGVGRVVMDIVVESKAHTCDQGEVPACITGEFRIDQSAVVDFSFR